MLLRKGLHICMAESSVFGLFLTLSPENFLFPFTPLFLYHEPVPSNNFKHLKKLTRVSSFPSTLEGILHVPLNDFQL